MTVSDNIKKDIRAGADPHKAEHLSSFFQCFPGGYGEGDRFLGVKVPFLRRVARNYYKKTALDEMDSLMRSGIHEHRLTALIMLSYKYDDAEDDATRDKIVKYYIRNMDCIDNWDLVDSSAPRILGEYFYDKKKDFLYELAKSGELWKQRIAVVSTQSFIKKGSYEDTLKMALILMEHEHHLIHKAVGWMLREIGKRNRETEFLFLKKHYRRMPRTMLRYAIERFEPGLRTGFLKGRI